MDDTKLGIIISIIFIFLLILIFALAGKKKEKDTLDLKNYHFYKNMLYLRIKKNKTYEQISSKTGIAIESLKDIDKEIYLPTLEEIDKLAKFFSVSREELVYRDFKFENKDWYLNQK